MEFEMPSRHEKLVERDEAAGARFVELAEGHEAVRKEIKRLEARLALLREQVKDNDAVVSVEHTKSATALLMRDVEWSLFRDQVKFGLIPRYHTVIGRFNREARDMEIKAEMAVGQLVDEGMLEVYLDAETQSKKFLVNTRALREPGLDLLPQTKKLIPAAAVLEAARAESEKVISIMEGRED